MKWKIALQYITFMVLITAAIVAIIFAGLNHLLRHDPKTEDSLAAPEQYTLDFGRHLRVEQDQVTVTEEGLRSLEAQGAWLQILDEYGQVMYAYRQPEHVPSHYSPGELAYYYKYSVKGSTLFIAFTELEGRRWSCLVGFPDWRISRQSMYYSPAKVLDFWPNGPLLMAGAIAAVVLTAGYLFAWRQTRPLWTAIEGMTKLSLGRYGFEVEPKGMYREVYESLNRLSRELSSADEQRARTERMREEWTANISHDLKTPLASIQGYAELLEDETFELAPGERRQYAAVIVRQSRYMEELLQDLKLTYQLKHALLPLTLEPADLVELLRSTLILLVNTPGRETVPIAFASDAERLLVSVDTKWLQRAFNNLITNAWLHNPPGTQIHITVTPAFSSHTVRVDITDDGNGISGEDLAQLFERYYRGTHTGGNHQGSGLGMAIAKDIVTAHSGSIRVSSTIGEGTTVSVTLPLARRAV